MALQHAPVRVVPRTALVSGLILCAAVGPLAGTGRAAAPASLKPAVTATNWYWAERAPSAAGMTGPTLPDQSVTAANVPAGDLGVGYANAQAGPADKVAAVAFDLTAVPLGSTFTRFQVTVPVDAAATQVQTGQPDVSACENIDAFQAGPGGGPLTDAPPVSDPSCVKGVFDPAKGYVFDLTAMANDWSGGAPSDGISLRPTTPDSTTAPFSIALKGKGAITTLAETTPPPVAVDDGGLAPAPSPAPTSAPAAAALPASAPVASVALPVSAPVAQVALPQTAPSPAVAAPPAPPVRIRAAGFVPPHDGPTSAWWLALLAGAGLLGATAVVLADPMAPAPVDARRARFSGAVRAGRRSA